MVGEARVVQRVSGFRAATLRYEAVGAEGQGNRVACFCGSLPLLHCSVFVAEFAKGLGPLGVDGCGVGACLELRRVELVHDSACVAGLEPDAGLQGANCIETGLGLQRLQLDTAVGRSEARCERFRRFGRPALPGGTGRRTSTGEEQAGHPKADAEQDRHEG